MMHDIQSASVWKRMSAWLLDVIVLLILATGFAFIVSVITNYSKYDEQLHAYYDEYEQTYDARIDITSEEYEQLSEEEKQKYIDMFDALNKDQDVLYVYNMTINLMMVIVSIAGLLSVIVTEYVIPLIFKNGQTIGKKVFGIGVVKINSIRITHLQLFVRAFLGKYAIELMIPALTILLLLFGHGGIFSIILLVGVVFFQLGLCIITKYHQAIHDILAYTAVVDLHTQMIFDNEEELLEYKKQNHLAEANK